MHQAEISAAPIAPADSGAAAPPERAPWRPEVQVTAIAVVLLACLPLLFWLIPDRWESVEPGGWWAFVAVVVMFAVAERTIFYVQFRREGIAFSLSEVPIVFALVFLAPGAALIARLLATVPVFVFGRKNRGCKLFFNIAITCFEQLVAIAVFRGLLEIWNGPAALLAICALSLVLIAPFTSIIISTAISRFEGNWRGRVGAELRGTWWMYLINAALGAMTVALALVEPPLALLAVLPALGMWYVIHGYGEVSQELRDLDALHGFTGRVGHSLQVDEIADVAVEELARLLRVDAAALVRFTSSGAEHHVSGDLGLTLPEAATERPWWSLIEDGATKVVPGNELRSVGIEVRGDVPAVLVAPLIDETGPFAFLLAVQPAAQVQRFDEATVSRGRNIAQQLAVSLRRGMLHERLEFEARHDALTGLPARKLFEREVADAVESSGDVPESWVLMLDLDRFKEVNDTLGHHAGDDLLVRFADRMTRLLGPNDVLARLAGDEFAVLCHRSRPEEVVEFARQCVAEGGRPVVLDGLEIVVTVSVGVAAITSGDEDGIQPMRRADIAMYNAKWQRTGVEFYRYEIDRRTPTRLSMLGDLRSAIQTDALDVVFQPKLDLRAGRIVGVEALVRWQHETRGIVAPAEFVRVAEDTGLIKDLTDLVLNRGIRSLRRFTEHGLDIGLAVNLSTHDLFDSRLPDRVRSLLATHDMAPGSLTLEITESSLLIDAPRTRATIDELHAAGVRMSVDDFGTGYSSLSYLRRLPVDELKIDQSFVANMMTDREDEVIVRSTVDLGHNLGLRVVAEGVESITSLERLRLAGCDIAQGYVIAQPMSADELLDWFADLERSREAGLPPSWDPAMQ